MPMEGSESRLVRGFLKRRPRAFPERWRGAGIFEKLRRRIVEYYARERGGIGWKWQALDIAVVDAGGNLKAHVRMDGAFVGSITISINKAYTAIAFQQQTAHLQEDTRPGGPIFGLSDAHG